MVLGIFLSLILASAASAVPPICSNLSAVACTEGVRNDGTGVSQLADSDRFASQEIEKMEPSIRQTFEQMLQAPDGRDLIPLAMDACRLHDMPNCKGGERNSQVCQRLIVTCFSSLYKTTELNPDLRVLYEREQEIKFFNAEDALTLVQEPAFVRAAEKITEKNSVLISQELKDKVAKNLFPTVQMLLRQRIRELPVDEQTRQVLDQKIASAKFDGIKCKKRDGVNYSTGLTHALLPNAHYDGDSNSFTICPAYLRYSSSEFDLVAIIAHELSHSIDPCNLAGGVNSGERRALSEALPDEVLQDRYLRKDFLSCFRSEASVGAKSYRPVNPPIAGSDAMIGNGLNRFCQSDQINEVVADWFAAEALAAYVPIRNSKIKPELTQLQVQTGISNVLRSSCGPAHNNEYLQDEHPTNNRRLNSIFLVQPKLRSMMGCPTEAPGRRYCDIQNPDALIGKVPLKAPPTMPPPTTKQAEQ